MQRILAEICFKKPYKLFALVCCLVQAFTLNAQINKNGIPLIRNYNPEVYGASSQNWAITRDNRGLMYFGNNFGLVQYDGHYWRLFVNESSSSNIRSLGVDNQGLVYYGASQDFGVMLPDTLGNLRHTSLYKIFSDTDPDFNDIWCINKVGNEMFFQAKEKIFRLKLPFIPLKPELTRKNLSVILPENGFHWSFSVYNRFYVREFGKGLMVLKNDKLELVPDGQIFANERIYAMLPYPENRILICTREKGLYVFDPAKTEQSVDKLECEANSLIIESQLYGGAAMENNCYALSTLNNGIIIIDHHGKVLEHLNMQSSLPDQQVLSVFSDTGSGNLWFATNESGIFNVNTGSPFRIWNKTNGLNGVVSDIVRFRGKIYVATSIGVFMLDETKPGFSGFQPVNGLMAECWDLLVFKTGKSEEDKLLAATANGIFEIKGVQANQLIGEGYIFQLSQSKTIPERLYIGYYDGFGAVDYNPKLKKWGEAFRNTSVNHTIRHIFEKDDGMIFLGTHVSGFIKLKEMFDFKPLIIDSAQGLPLNGSDFKVFSIDNEIVFSSYNGLFKYLEDSNKVVPYTKFGEELSNSDLGVFNMQEDEDGYWVSCYSNKLKKSNWQGVIKLKRQDGGYVTEESFLKIIPQKIALAMLNDSNYFWLANEKGIFKFDKYKRKDYNRTFITNILKVSTTEDSVLFAGTFYNQSDTSFNVTQSQTINFRPVLKYKDNQVTIEYAASFFEQEENILYSYRLVGLTDKWSKWSIETKFPFTNLPPGDYRFEVKGKNIYGTISEPVFFEFTILPPWYRTIVAYIGFGLAVILLVWLIVWLNIKRLKRDKERLEGIVAERTTEIRMKNAELEQQKEEILAQRDEIEVQRDQVTRQKEMIEEQNKNITDSIHYASRIQEALLPPVQLLDELFPKHFVMFKPRDIVSGDFYWASRKGNKSIIVAADCTGHGVPGAFMSMLGISFLNEIINKFEMLHANQILDELKANVKKSLRQTGKDNEAKDGMDMALCIIDYDNMLMEYAGAYNSLLMIRDNEIVKFEADRMPIGIYLKEKEGFTNHIIELKPGDNFYLHSDGYIDQFGGEQGNKLMVKRFRELLLQNHHKTVDEQKKTLEEFMKHWLSFRGKTGESFKQIDDILVIGIQI